MKKSFLSAIALAAMSLFGVSSAWAQSYVTTAVNASDNSKQDVTYTFNGSASDYPSTGLTVGTTAVAYLYNGTSTTNLYQCTTEGLTRFAFHAVGTSGTTGYWSWVSSSTGLRNYGGSSSNSTSSNEGFAITGLKSGDKVVVTGKNMGSTTTPYASCPGATSVNGTEQEATKLSGEATYTVTTSADATTTSTIYFTYTLTTDGYITMDVCRNKYSYISSVVITEDKPAVAAPTYSITGTSGIYRTVTLSCTTEGAAIYYSSDGSLAAGAAGWTTYNSETGAVTESATLYAYASDGTNNSSIVTIETGAGSAMALNAPTITLSGFTESNGIYSPEFTFTSDQSSVLGTPEVSYSYTIGTTSGTGDSYTAAETGTLTVMVSADGYADATESVEIPAYQYAQTFYYDVTTLTTNSGTTVGDALTVNSVSSQPYSIASDAIENLTLSSNITQLCNASDPTTTYALYARMDDGTITYDGTFPTGSYLVGYRYYGDNLVYSETNILSIVKYAHASQIAVYVPAITKTIGSSGFATFSAATNTVVPEGVTVYTAAKQDESTILATSIDAATTGAVLPADNGFIIKGTAGSSYAFIPSTSTATVSVSEDNALKANTSATTFAATDNNYGLLQNEPTFALISATLPANTAYLNIASASEAKSLQLVFSDGTATGVSKIVAAEGASDGKVYNLAGQLVSESYKGVVIKNGKKYLNK